MNRRKRHHSRKTRFVEQESAGEGVFAARGHGPSSLDITAGAAVDGNGYIQDDFLGGNSSVVYETEADV